jgi:hypothetical protein
MCRIFMIVCSVFFLIAHANAASVQWPVSEGGNGHYYEAIYVPGEITWTNANAAATAMGGYLATISSAQENAFVYSLVDDDRYWYMGSRDPATGPGNDLNGPWLGGWQNYSAPDYSEPAGGWNWVTGEPFTYTNWHPGEPDNSGGVQDILVFYGNGFSVADRTAMWGDNYHINATALGYVVESVPEPSTFVLLGLGIITTLAYAWRRRAS